MSYLFACLNSKLPEGRDRIWLNVITPYLVQHCGYNKDLLKAKKPKSLTKTIVSCGSLYFPKIITTIHPNPHTLPKCELALLLERRGLRSLPLNLGGAVTVAEVKSHDF